MLRVTEEVTKRLPPTDIVTPGSLSEVPLVSGEPAGSNTNQEPIAPSTAGAIVQGSLLNTQANLSGEQQLPSQLFSSPSLPIDARVSEKIRAKIWNNEYFDFSALLSSPIFEDKNQVTIATSKTSNSHPSF